MKLVVENSDDMFVKLRVFFREEIDMAFKKHLGQNKENLVTIDIASSNLGVSKSKLYALKKELEPQGIYMNWGKKVMIDIEKLKEFFITRGKK